VLNKEHDGFVLNRLQAVLLAEAFRIVGEGVASPQDVDKTIREGLGLRWSFMGPFETIELNAPAGIADYCARYGPSLAAMAEQCEGGDPFGARNVAAILAQWGDAPAPDRVKALADWRDSRLAALKAHKRGAPQKPD
jgi:3-hydroxyacyl-CoA dehydrogenase